MRRILSGAMVATMVLTLAAGCSSESDDDVFSQLDNEDDNGSDDTPLGGEAQAYADAVAAAGQYDDPDDDSDIPLSEDSSVCYGEAYVEIVGVERMAEKVTPEEIEADPGKDGAEWGIEISKDEGVEVFRALVDCSPEVLQEFGEGLATGLGEGALADGDFDADCLASVDPADVEDMMGASIAGGEDYDPNEAEAGSLVDWLMGCGDMSSVLLGAFADDPRFPDGTVECITARLDEELVREFLVVSMTAADDAAIENSEAGTAFIELVTDCTTGG